MYFFFVIFYLRIRFLYRIPNQPSNLFILFSTFCHIATYLFRCSMKWSRALITSSESHHSMNPVMIPETILAISRLVKGLAGCLFNIILLSRPGGAGCHLVPSNILHEQIFLHFWIDKLLFVEQASFCIFRKYDFDFRLNVEISISVWEECHQTRIVFFVSSVFFLALGGVLDYFILPIQLSKIEIIFSTS